MTDIQELEDRIKKLEDREHMNLLAKINPQKGDILIIKRTHKSQMRELRNYFMGYGMDIPMIYVKNEDMIRIVHPSKIILEEKE